MITYRISQWLGIALCLTSLAVAQEIPADTTVVTTESGLSYSVLQAGDGGQRPGPAQVVRVHYTGWLTDGTQFDSSRDRGEPSTFPLNGVIAGWSEGLQLMSKGARFKFTIPWKLAYGEQGRPPKIPAKADLIFDVELLDLAPTIPSCDDKDKQKTESGITYCVQQKGEGPKHSGDQIYRMAYSLFTEEGQYVDGTWTHGSLVPARAIEGIKGLAEIAPMMKVGDRWAVWTPAGMGSGPDPQVWTLELRELVDPPKMPDFVMPPASELTTTASGLQYKVIESGDADKPSPKMGMPVTVHYAGWLTDGTLFDASYKGGEAATFRLGEVIQGWNEGLQLMKPGAQYLFVIPAKLAYGDQANGEIPAGSTLVFHVHLLDSPR